MLGKPMPYGTGMVHLISDNVALEMLQPPPQNEAKLSQTYPKRCWYRIRLTSQSTPFLRLVDWMQGFRIRLTMRLSTAMCCQMLGSNRPSKS